MQLPFVSTDLNPRVLRLTLLWLYITNNEYGHRQNDFGSLDDSSCFVPEVDYPYMEVVIELF